MGIKVVFHSDGDLRLILPDLLATGIDGLNPIDTSAGMTLAETRNIVGPDLLLVGGIDNQIMTSGTTGDVRKHLREQISIMDGTPWWITNSSEEFDDSIPVSNILALLETIGIL